MPTGLREREHAERERSRQEALSTVVALHADERQVSRYIDPPLGSPFPLEHAYALLGEIQGKTVLDLGCGTGENSLLLARRGARVVGVDISPDLIQLARRWLDTNHHAGAAEFVVGSAHHLPLAAETIDIVLGVAVLHHLDLERAAREVRRVLKVGGRLQGACS